MVELICLACGRTNPADAKFCSQCGTALLRRFCDQCRAVNDADAHFCQACGAALSAQPLPAAFPPEPDNPPAEERATPPPGDPIPTLNEVLADETAATRPAPTLQPFPVQAPIPERDARTPGDGAVQTARPAHRRALLAVGALIVLLLVAALWSRVPRTDVRPREAATSSTQGAAPAEVPAPPPAPSVKTEPASASTVDGAAPAEDNAPAASEGGKAGEPAPEAAPAPFDKPRPATPRRSVATPSRPSRGTPTPTPSPAPAPAPKPALECTRQADALGLCAPGSTITGR